MEKNEWEALKIQESLGSRIKRFRQDRNISQEELAFRAGINRTYLSDIETGRRNPALLNICWIAKSLGVNPSVLLEEIKFYDPS